ncbi:MAG: LD-carboxypeptidase [Weeksellaceae bacterium]
MRKHIYVCTPSAPFDAQRFQLDHAIKNLDRLGFDVTVAKHALDDVGNTSASIQDRLDDLYISYPDRRPYACDS